MRTISTGRGRGSFLDTYFRDIDRTPLLSASEEKELAQLIREGDSEARDRLIRANLRLVVNIARHFTGQGVDLQDLIEEGNLGLVRAVEGFDPEMNCRFSTYAAYWIRQSIKKLLVSAGKAIRVPMYMAQMMRDWRREVVRLEAKLNRPPTEEEISQALHLSAKKLKMIKKALMIYNAGPRTGRSEEEPSVDELIPSGSTGPEIALEKDLLQEALKLLDKLDPREATVLRLRFGLEDGQPRSLKEIGQVLGLTRERIRQIESDALKKLFDMLQGEGR